MRDEQFLSKIIVCVFDVAVDKDIKSHSLFKMLTWTL